MLLRVLLERCIVKKVLTTRKGSEKGYRVVAGRGGNLRNPSIWLTAAGVPWLGGDVNVVIQRIALVEGDERRG